MTGAQSSTFPLSHQRGMLEEFYHGLTQTNTQNRFFVTIIIVIHRLLRL